jgi:preprotein translocase subunit SecD
MTRLTCSVTTLFFATICCSAWSQNTQWQPTKKLPDGVYEVLRNSLKEKNVLPLKPGEVLAVNRHRYAKHADKEPPRFLVLRSAADVRLDLAEPAKAEKQGDEVVRILLKLQPKAAKTLEKLTTTCLDRQLAIVLGGEVVTAHKVSQVIRDGQVQITGCAEGATNYLLEHIRVHQEGRVKQ